jgi:hypothetical protein
MLYIYIMFILNISMVSFIQQYNWSMNTWQFWIINIALTWLWIIVLKKPNTWQYIKKIPEKDGQLYLVVTQHNKLLCGIVIGNDQGKYVIFDILTQNYFFETEIKKWKAVKNISIKD